MSKFVGIVVGGLEIVAGVAIGFLSLGALAPISGLLIAAGAGSILSGVGTLIASAITGGGAGSMGVSTTSRNPVAMWSVVYGRSVVGGTLVFVNEFGDNDKYLDLVIVLACHQCQSVDKLLFNKQLVQMQDNGDGTFDSFSPLQQTVNIFHISRTDDIVTVILHANIPLLTVEDTVIISGITGDHTLNGTFPVAQIISQVPTPSPGSITFTYICGGINSIVDLEGTVKTTWVDYGRKVHMEVLLGTHSATFPGMISGTPNDGNHSDIVTNSSNPWGAQHQLLGRTSVFLRLHYNDTYFSGGIPQISFQISGKNDILDVRTSTRGYTENSALCTADFLSNTSFGFKAAYTTEIPTAQLIAAANTCDEAVTLAPGGTEPRYACNGKFDLSSSRGTILQNMLTSCAGRLTYTGGQFIIWPAAWNGSSPANAPILGQMSGPYRYKPTVAIRDLYNGVKGTYVSPANKWQASDIPPYAQDVIHGYSADANLAADGGDRRWLDIQLPFTISSAAAQRICKIELLRHRNMGTGTFRYNMSGYSVTTLDVLKMTVPFLAWSNKLVEVTAHRFTLDRQQSGDSDVLLLGTEIDVQETDASIYDWSDTEELTPQGYQQPAVPDGFAPAPPTDVTAISNSTTAIIGPGGKVTDVILVSWDTPTDGYVINGGHMEVRYQLQGGSLWTGLPSVDPSVTQVPIVGVVDESIYNVSVRSVSGGGVPSAWIATDPVRANGARPPIAWKPYGEINTFTTYGYGIGLVQFSDVSGNALAIRGMPPVNVLSTALTVGPIIDAVATVSPLISGNLPVGNFVILAFAVDSSGRYSPESNLMDVTILSTASQITFNAQWPAGTVSYQLFFGKTRDTLVGDWDPIVGTPASITITSEGGSPPSFALGGFGPPDSRYDHHRIRAKSEIHGGITTVNHFGSTAETTWSAAVNYVYGDRVVKSGNHYIAVAASLNHSPVPSTITSFWAPIGTVVITNPPSPLTVNALAGRHISIVSHANLPSTQPWGDQVIAGNTASGVIILASPMEVDVGDLLLIRLHADIVSATTIGDSGLIAPVNVWVPGGLSPNEGTYVVRIILDPSGAATGETARILSNTTTTYTVEKWKITPGVGSIFIVEEAAWKIDLPTVSNRNSLAPSATFGPSPVVVATIPSSTLQNTVAMVLATLEDADGNQSTPIVDNWREIYVVPTSSGNATPGGGYYTIIPGADGNILIDLAKGLKQRFILGSPVATSILAAGGISDSALSATISDSSPFSVMTLPFYANLPDETVLVTAHTGFGVNDVWTITRGQNGTTPLVHPGGASVRTVPLVFTPIWTGGIINDGTPLTVYEDMDPTTTQDQAIFVQGTNGFAADVTLWPISPTPGTRTSFVLNKHGSVWGLDSDPRNNGSIT